MELDTVGDLAGDLGHPLAHRGQEHPRRPVGVGAGMEHGRHQGVAVEVAAEVQLLAVVPARPDGPYGEDELTHPGRRLRPGHREPLLDVGLDLAPEPEDEPPAREVLKVVAEVRQRHRVAGERHRDAGAELEVVGVLGRQDEGEERIVAGLGAEDAVVPDRLELPGRLARPDQPSGQHAVDLHGRRLNGSA